MISIKIELYTKQSFALTEGSYCFKDISFSHFDD